MRAKPKLKYKVGQVVVKVARDSFTGIIYSSVIQYQTMDSKGFPVEQVIERARATFRGDYRSVDAVIYRAKHLAEIIGAPYDEDFNWHCALKFNRACRCPECIQAGRV